ncbi:MULTISPECIES: DDE-type integrase/transposase/recombinase [Paenibacillus]|uniref:DDE-type integrase/transposase/recombinase n=1 Tax=Paenibacillus TaxID=44249 RepID=UPI0020B6CBEA|nr:MULTISPECIES: DDE-type integrase/transposase/recombinase [Paenibacillus]MCP3794591.1 DDE-type integrase/transposase/recombinase [Paenibacillus sp. CH40]
MNHKKALWLLQTLGIRSQIHRKQHMNYKVLLTERVIENLLKRAFQAEQPNQKWVMDVTQYHVQDTWLYLWVIKDLLNNEIVVYHISLLNDSELVLRTFAKSFEKLKDVTRPVIHSNQDSSARLMLTMICCIRLAPKSACFARRLEQIRKVH